MLGPIKEALSYKAATGDLDTIVPEAFVSGCPLQRKLLRRKSEVFGKVRIEFLRDDRSSAQR